MLYALVNITALRAPCAVVLNLLLRVHCATALVGQHVIASYQRHFKWTQRVLVTCILLFRLDLLFSHAAPAWLRSVIMFRWIWQRKFGGIWPGLYFFDLSATNINGIVAFSVWSVHWVVCISQITYIHANKDSQEFKLNYDTWNLFGFIPFSLMTLVSVFSYM